MKKKVTAIESEEGKTMTVTAVVVQQGCGKGNHPAVGTVVKNRLKSFASWAVK